MGSARPSLDLLQECMKSTTTIRNVCILAHVDHGKTTIADSLLATNRLVSKRMAGFARYLDDRIDEQERGITMKSSTVSLLNLIPKINTDNTRITDAVTDNHKQPLLLNLIDTPGHIDFSSEVGAALRLCDGALVIVDLVEGVCVQTREAIKNAFFEKCHMILVLNKIDKLIVELNKDVNEIFLAITHAIEDCNAIIAELYQYEVTNIDTSDRVTDIEDTGLLFTPDTGKVIFVSAIDGWGFTTKQFAEIFVDKLENNGIDDLNRKLWDFDAWIDPKTNLIKSGAIAKAKPNLFIQLCLKTIVFIYSTIVLQMQKDKIDLILKKLKIGLVTREMGHNDPKIQLRAIMQAWSPISEVLLQQIAEIVPPPNRITLAKCRYLLDFDKYLENEARKLKLDTFTRLIGDCSPKNEAIAYVSKLFCVDNRNLSENKPKVFVPRPKTDAIPEKDTKTNEIVDIPIEKGEDFTIIALARVFSGNLHTGQEITVYLSNSAPVTVNITSLYMLFGRELIKIDEITSGNVCGIAGLDQSILRSATLSTIDDFVPFIEHPSPPAIVRNAIEPVNPKDLPILRRGLRILMQSDSCVQVQIQESGEHVLLTAGDVHLAKCLRDLTTIFAKIEVSVSSPMVSLRETVQNGGERKHFENSIEIEVTPVKIEVCVLRLEPEIWCEIAKNRKILKIIEEHESTTAGYELYKKHKLKQCLHSPKLKEFKTEALLIAAKNMRKNMADLFEKAGPIWAQFSNGIWSIGESSDSVNLLINATSDYKRNIFETLDESDSKSIFDQYLINAFNSTCKSGPLCEEPVKNCAFIVKKMEVFDDFMEILDGSTRSGVTIESNFIGGFREAFLKQNPRLMEPMFTTSIQVNTNILGKVYSVVNKRHGRVLDAVGMDEQEKTFLVKAEIPVIESEGFANEMRKTTSGQAMPSLKFSHFEVIDGDPFYVPKEDDDDEDEGINIEAASRATKLRKEIRKRKGLHVEEQVVIYAEKQRTLNKKK